MSLRKKIIYVLLGLLCFVMGAGVMFGVLYLYPKTVVKTIREENVNITDTGISAAVDKIKDSVVVVEVYSGKNLVSTGTGFVYDQDEDLGYIMTNHHVIEDAGDIKITYSDDSEGTASVVGSDQYADIAVLRIPKEDIKSVADIGKSNDMKVGDTVFTIGSPMGIDFRGTVTRGILSGKDRLVSVNVNSSQADWIMNVMQTDAAINPGNSGGPLCNANGEVIGINSLKIVKDTIEGIGFSIPIEDAVSYANSLREKGSISRPYIGVSMLNASSTMQLAYAGLRIDKDVQDGVVVVEIESGSPGDKAGLIRGDIIVKVGDDWVSDIAEFRYRLYSYSPDETIEITVLRDGKEEKVKVKLSSN